MVFVAIVSRKLDAVDKPSRALSNKLVNLVKTAYIFVILLEFKKASLIKSLFVEKEV